MGLGGVEPGWMGWGFDKLTHRMDQDRGMNHDALRCSGYGMGVRQAHPPDGPRSWFEQGFLDYICPQLRRGLLHNPASCFEYIKVFIYIQVHYRR